MEQYIFDDVEDTRDRVFYNSLLSKSKGLISGRDLFRKTGGRYDTINPGFGETDSPSTLYFKIFFCFRNGRLLDITSPRVGGFGLKRNVGVQNIHDNSALNFLYTNGEYERANLLKEFVVLLSNISIYSPWYFQNVTGIDELLRRPELGGNEFNPVAEDAKTIAIKCLEDAYDQRIGTLLDLYKAACFSQRLHKEIVPANLRKFDMIIYIFNTPIRNNPGDFSHSPIQDINDPERISSKMIELKNCEFDLSSNASAFSDLNNAEGFKAEYTINIKVDTVYEQRYNQFLTTYIGDLIDWDINYRLSANEQRTKYDRSDWIDSHLWLLMNRLAAPKEPVVLSGSLGSIATTRTSQVIDNVVGAVVDEIGDRIVDSINGKRNIDNNDEKKNIKNLGDKKSESKSNPLLNGKQSLKGDSKSETTTEKKLAGSIKTGKSFEGTSNNSILSGKKNILGGANKEEEKKTVFGKLLSDNFSDDISDIANKLNPIANKIDNIIDNTSNALGKFEQEGGKLGSLAGKIKGVVDKIDDVTEGTEKTLGSMSTEKGASKFLNDLENKAEQKLKDYAPKIAKDLGVDKFVDNLDNKAQEVVKKINPYIDNATEKLGVVADKIHKYAEDKDGTLLGGLAQMIDPVTGDLKDIAVDTSKEFGSLAKNNNIVENLMTSLLEDDKKVSSKISGAIKKPEMFNDDSNKKPAIGGHRSFGEPENKSSNMLGKMGMEPTIGKAEDKVAAIESDIKKTVTKNNVTQNDIDMLHSSMNDAVKDITFGNLYDEGLEEEINTKVEDNTHIVKNTFKEHLEKEKASPAKTITSTTKEKSNSYNEWSDPSEGSAIGQNMYKGWTKH